MLIEEIHEATKNLKREGIRTFLTLLGIIIGIAAIVSLISVGAGLGVAVEKQLDELGGKTILIIPAGMQNVRLELNDSDIEGIEKTSGVESVVPIYTTSAILEFNGEKVNVSVNAVDAKKAELFSGTGFFDVAKGRDFTGNESGSVLIGNKVGTEYFEKEINIGKQIKINGQEFKVIGILKAQPQSFGGGPDTGNSIFMSLDAFRRISSSTVPAIIFANAFDKDEATDVANKIEKKLWDKYGDNSVIVFSSEELLQQVNMLLGMLTLFIAGLAGISIIVGGIGIMNAMVTSVIERTKEIGVYKAIGASNNKILLIFLFEASLIGGVGGIIGIALGIGLGQVIALVGTASGFALFAVTSIELVIGALLFSIIIGALSGFYPALRAARLDPVAALRYE